MGFDFKAINDGIQKVANAANALVGEGGKDNTVTIRHAGITITVPLAGNENKTVIQILRMFGGDLAIPTAVQPAVTAPGVGDVDVNALAQDIGAKIWDVFTEKKENAS